MRPRKALATAVLVITSLVLGFSATSSVASDTFTIELAETSSDNISYFNAAKYSGANGAMCTRLSDRNCRPGADTELTAIFHAPKCDTSREVNCVDGVFAQVSDQTVRGIFLGYVSRVEIPANRSAGILGRGASTSLWQIPGVVHAGGTDTYAVRVQYDLNYSGNRFRAYPGFQASILPYAEKSDPSAKDQTVTTNQIFMSPTGCHWSKNGVCGSAQEFSPGSLFGLQLRFESHIQNWFAARMSNVDIKVQERPSSSKSIQIVGSPVQVATLSAQMPKANIPAKLKKIMARIGLDPRQSSGWLSQANDGFSTEIVEAVKVPTRDQASGYSSAWNLEVVPNGIGAFCTGAPNRVLGIVSTNSMAFQPGPPQFRGGFLNYEVAGLHYLPGGEQLALGTYDLVISSDYARCLYGFSQAPISGSVAVVNDRGQKTVATTTFGEKNGWVKLSAKGFTFSKKTIRVKITKAKR
jgi:hypothetical protein